MKSIFIQKGFYVLDTHRLFPPEEPIDKKCYLYRLLRPELVKNNPVPLSGDSFSRFQKPEDAEESNNEVRDATKRLFEQIIPDFANQLNYDENNKLVLNSNLRDICHRAGINMRHLDKLRLRVTNPFYRSLLLQEMLCR